VRLMRDFLAHERITQWRSMRFRGLVAVYVVVASAPAAVAFLASWRMPRVLGPAAYNMLLISLQPLLTALFAVGLAVDAIARERDEGSFGVLSIAPVSSAGYVLRRWLSVVILCIAVSLLPTAITAALAAHARATLPLLPMFAEAWLISVLPSLLVASALAIALGTITGRTVLAVIFGALLISAGIGYLNMAAFYFGLNFGGPAELFTGGSRAVQELLWTVRGFWFPRVPSDAAFPLRSRARDVLAGVGITAAMAVVLLAAAAFYLRRTRRDLRPWRIRETHQLRTMLRTLNRVREEYAPDAGSSTADRLALATAIVLAALLVAYLIRRQSMFVALGDARYAAEGQQGVPTSSSIAAESLRIDAGVTLGGHVRSRSTSVIRNDGAQPQAHLSFMLQPLMSIRRAAADRGSARVRRAWQRVDLELDPPLAPGERRTLSFDVDGTPGEVDFELQPPGNFAARWNRRRHATQPIYMTDLARSRIVPAASEVRMRLAASDLAPVIRYTAWTLQDESYTPEVMSPPAAIDVHLQHPYALAVDSCGAMTARGALDSRCTAAPASYEIFGGPLARRTLGAEATLAYIPAHQSIAVTQSSALASSVGIAARAWPGLRLPAHVIFIERPTDDRNAFFEWQPWRSVEEMGSAVFFVPEAAFTARTPVSANGFAAAIINGVLQAQRRVAPDQAGFFRNFYTAAASARLGMRRMNAVDRDPGVPDTMPLLAASWRLQRMARVLAALEYRVGADNFRAGIEDFLRAGGGPGTAKELVVAIGRRAGLDLSRTYRDYFAGEALPELTLVDVAFRRDGATWQVSGAVKNNGTGEAFVPVALRTSQESLWQTLRVDSGGVARFAFTASGEPRAVQLDPDGVCYRRGAVGLVDNVEYRGER
jgi:ABC-type transport system involved in multi-copper enzyme maturation permease subunit